jgi:hypothetical protein
MRELEAFQRAERSQSKRPSQATDQKVSTKARRCKDQKAQRQEARTEGGPKRKGDPKKARSRSEEGPKENQAKVRSPSS